MEVFVVKIFKLGVKIDHVKAIPKTLAEKDIK